MKKFFLFFLLHTFTVQSQIKDVTIELLSQFRGHGSIRTYDIYDDKLFAVAGDYLEVFDISEFGTYKKLGEYHYIMDNNAKPTKIKVRGNYLFSNNGSKGLYVIDISDMNNIKPRRSFIPSITNIAQGFIISKNLIFMNQVIGYGSSSVLLADISDPLNIAEKGYFTFPFYSESFSVLAKGNELFIIAQKYYEYSYQGADLIIVDISDNGKPIEKFSQHSGFSGLALQDNYLLTTDTTKTLKIFDISDAYNPKIVNEIPINNNLFSLDNYHLVTRNFSYSGIVYDYKFELFNTVFINNVELKDSLMLESEVNDPIKNHHIFNDRLILQKDSDISIYDISDNHYNFDKNISFPDYFYALDILIDSDIAYVSTTESLLIFNISDLLHPILLSSYAHLTPKTKIYKHNDIIYLGNRMIDVSDKFNPILSAYIPQDGNIKDVFVKDNLLYSLDNGFRILDVEDANNPHYIEGSYYPIENGEYIYVDSSYVYIVNNTKSDPYLYSSKLQIYQNVNNSLDMLGATPLNNDPTSLIINSDYAYEGFVSKLPGNYEHGINIYDISDKLNPKFVSSYLTSDLVIGMKFDNNLLLLAQNYDGLKVLDVSNKKAPKLITEYNTSGRTFGIDVNDNNIFIADYDGGMNILTSNFSSSNDGEQNPSGFTLLQNFPNPFNSITQIKFYLPVDSRVQLSIYNTLGSKIDNLSENLIVRGWHLLNYYPRGLASGIYFLSLKSNNERIIKKIVYLK